MGCEHAKRQSKPSTRSRADVVRGTVETTARPGTGRWLRPLLVVAAVALLALLWLTPLRDVAGGALRGRPGEVRTELRAAGAWGPLLLMALIVLHAVIPYPAEVPTAAAGYVFGLTGGLLLCVVSWALCALATYWLGARAGRPLALRVAGAGRVARLEALLERGGAPALLIARLIPIVPFNLLGYLAGAARVGHWRFTWTSIVGSLPLTTAIVVLGTRLREPSLTDPVLLVIGGGFLSAAGLGAVVARRRRRRTAT